LLSRHGARVVVKIIHVLLFATHYSSEKSTDCPHVL
jgi:hypothetical protein